MRLINWDGKIISCFNVMLTLPYQTLGPGISGKFPPEYAIDLAGLKIIISVYVVNDLFYLGMY